MKMPKEPRTQSPGGKLGAMAALLRQPDGATIEQLVQATGWQPHSVRGAMSGALKKKHGLTITSEKSGSSRVYRAIDGVEA